MDEKITVFTLPLEVKKLVAQGLLELFTENWASGSMSVDPITHDSLNPLLDRQFGLWLTEYALKHIGYGGDEALEAVEFFFSIAKPGAEVDLSGPRAQKYLRRCLAQFARHLTGHSLGPLYSTIGPHVTFDSVEIGCLRRNPETGIEGYMIVRQTTNPRFPSQRHFPGIQMQWGENDQDAMQRAVQSKYCVSELVVDGAQFVARLNPSKREVEMEPGGLHIIPHLYLVIGDKMVLPEDERGGWVPLGQKLPEDMVYSHIHMARYFTAAYERYERSEPVCVGVIQNPYTSQE